MHNQGDFLSGGGEMGALIRAKDWSKTPLGAPERWPHALRIALRIVLDSRHQMFLWWGPDLIIFNNDAYIPVHGARHPWALGQPAAVVWQEIWDTLGPQAEAVLRDKLASWNEDQLLTMERNGYPEETFFTYSYSPVQQDDGTVGGVLCACTENTDRVIGERRLTILRQLSAATAGSQSVSQACRSAAQTFESHSRDVAFALIYLSTSDGKHAELYSTAGIAPDDPIASKRVPMTTDEARSNTLWPTQETMNGMSIVLDNLREQAVLPGGYWPEPTHTAMVLPLKGSQGELIGFIVLGASPRRPFDDHYRGFFELAGRQVETAVTNARAYEEEKRRAEGLAELDRAKTAFFSNVSHEFRTPLTLMLSPVEELLSNTDLTPAAKGQLAIVNRNGLRLLRLVNSLLDFSRIEAGRMQARYEATDLAAFTAELASSFRSAIELAGLRFVVDCSPLSEPVYVDREMWETIVLNLLSNAFKFTFVGRIAVTVRRREKTAELVIRDTGVGVPEESMPRLFERFYRVENSQGRTHEGSGIGLALVQELIKLHGGAVRAESKTGEGTAFIVTVPLGSAHLPAEKVVTARGRASVVTGAISFVEEALRWLPDQSPSMEESPREERPPVPSPQNLQTDRPRIVLADDNADMRQYIARLLAERYAVEAVADGEAALAAAQERRPDLILSDIMMPRLDGFGLLRDLRNDPSLRNVPVILLSARAGEEARIEGLEHSADDYLIKPFSARELLARVQAHLDMARVRREYERTVRESEARFRHMADNSPVMVRVTEPDGACSFLSRSWYDFTGQTPESGLGFGWLEAIHPEDRESAEAIFRAANSEQRPFRLEYRVQRHDGAYRWAIDWGAPRLGLQGDFLGYIGSVMDITERKEAEEALRESEEQFRAIVSQATAGVAQTDPKGAFVLVNQRYCDLTGYSREELLTMRMQDITHPEDLPRNLESFAQLLRDGPDFVIEKRYIRKDGTIVWVNNSVSAVRDAAGSPQSVVAVVLDITERKRHEQQLAEQTRLLNLSNDAIIVRDVNERITFWNHGAEEIYGWRGDEALGKNLYELLETEFSEPLEQIVEKLGLHNRWTGEITQRRRDGTHITVATRWALDRNAQGMSASILQTDNDISERLEAEKAKARLAAIVESSDDAIVSKDLEGLIKTWNRGAERLFGYAAEETIGKPVTMLIPPERFGEEREILQRIRRGESVEHYETVRLRKDGAVLDISLTISPIFDGQGRVIGASKVARDITERKRHEKELRRWRDELEVRVQARTKELVLSQNRLREMASQVSMAEQRERSKLARDLHDYLAQMLVVGRMKMTWAKKQLAALSPAGEAVIQDVDDILQQALSYTRTTIAELSPPSLQGEGLPEALKWLSERFQKDGLRVEFRSDCRMVPLPEEQGVTLFQSVRELLFNVLKHSGVDQAKVTLAVEPDGGVQVIVEDRGKGMDDDAMRRGAEPGHLGLFSVSERLEALGGNVEVLSGPNQGTTVILWLPYTGTQTRGEMNGTDETLGDRHDAKRVTPIDASPAFRLESPACRVIRVLLADDHAMIRQGLRAVLETYEDIELVGEASDGEEAESLVEKLLPAVVIMDINMPKKNGIEATAKIKARHPGLIIIGLSVDTDSGSRTAMMNAGAKILLTKEAAVEQLYGAIQEAVKK